MLLSARSTNLLQHVIDRLAEEYAARPARIVGHHAADSGAAGRGNVGSKTQSQRRQLCVELVQNDARFNPDPTLFRVYFQYTVVVLRSVNAGFPRRWPVQPGRSRPRAS